MGFKIVAKGFNCPCMQSCRLFFDVNYVNYVNICSLLPFKNYSKGRRRTFVRWWLLLHIRIASPPSCALKEVCGTRLNMHKPISAPTTILYHTDSKHNTMTHAPFLHTILTHFQHSDICMCAIIPWFNFLLSVVELCKGIVSVDWIWMVCTCSVDSLVAAACYKVQLFVREQSCCPPPTHGAGKASQPRVWASFVKQRPPLLHKNGWKREDQTKNLLEKFGGLIENYNGNHGNCGDGAGIQKLPFTKVCTSTSPSLQILARLQFAVVLSHVVTPRNVLSDFCAILLPAAHALEVAMKVDRR